MQASSHPRRESGGRLKVAYFTNSIAIGGMEKHVVELASSVSKADCEVCAIVPGTKEVTPFVEWLRDANIPVHELDISGAQPKQQLAAHWLQLRKLLRDERIDVFHQHRTGPYHGKWACLAARLANVPAIVATEHLPAFRLRGLSLGINAAADKLVDRIITVCELDRVRQLRETWRGKDKVVTIHNGIDLSRFRLGEGGAARTRAALGLGSRSPVLGVFARLVPVKGINHLLNALPSLIAQWPEMVLLVGGEGSERDALEAQTAALGLCNHVKFLGQRSDVSELLGAIDLLVLPSENESFPIVLLEAMAMGRVVVATDVGGVSEAVIDGVTGRVVPPRDPQALAAAISGCLRNDALADMGRSARTRVEELFTAETMTAKTIDLYHTLLERARSDDRLLALGKENSAPALG